MTVADAFERATFGLGAEPALAGLEIIERTSRRHGAGCELRLVLDRPGGEMDLSTCERVAARINHALEACTEPYTLHVESAGLDRPLREPNDYERFRGQPVRIKTTLPVAGRKTHRGTLLGARGSTIIALVDSVEFPIPFELIESANIEFDIRADLTRAKKERKDARKSR